MIIVRVMGGLGNQMQQYALYRKLEMLGRDAGLDFSWFDREIQEKMQAPREPELNRFSGLSMKTVSSGADAAGAALRRAGGTSGKGEEKGKSRLFACV